MNGNFFTKQFFLFNFLVFILHLHSSNLTNTYCTIVSKKIFQNDENAECDEHEDDGEKICENSDENAHFISEAMK